MNRAKELSETLHQLQNNSSTESCDKDFHESFALVDQLIKTQENLERFTQEHINKLQKVCNSSSEHAIEATKKIEKRYNGQMKILRESKKAEEQQLSTEKNVLDEITDKMHNIELDQKSLTKKEAELKYKKDIDIERERATFKLLTNTLKIKWDYTCSKDKVQGFVSGKPPTPFTVNRQEHSSYYTANYLWDLIELTK